MRIPSLDGLRAISIALVLTTHLAGSRHFLSADTLAHAGDLGNLGVRTFFVISGYLITRLLLVELDRTRTISLKAFYARRFLRIFPAFYVFVAALTILGAVGFLDMDRSDFVHAVTYTMNYHVTEHFPVRHLWSLSVEEQFYLLWPITLVLLGVRRSLWTLVGVMIAVPAVRVVLYATIPGHDELIRTSFETVCDALATGCVLAIIMPVVSQHGWFKRLVRHPLFALLPAAILLANLQNGHPNAFFLVCIPFMNVAIAVLIARYVEHPDLPAARVLNSRLFITVGVASYSLYLWQELFLIQFRPPQSMVQVFPLNLLMTMACAAASYLLVEQPFLRLKGRFTAWARSSNRSTPAPAPQCGTPPG
jgi:peptidoglycan/LPS O-acetylase OafA/YrhL